MKKIAIISVAIVFCAAYNYPKIFVKSVIQGCVEQGEAYHIPAKILNPYCHCTIEYIQSKYAFKDLMQKLKNPSEKIAIVQDAALHCKNKLIYKEK